MSTPNPFDNPELFGIHGNPTAQEPANQQPVQQPVYPQAAYHPPQPDPRVDPRVDQMQAQMELLGKRLNTVINHLKKQQAEPEPLVFTTRGQTSPGPQMAEPTVQIRTEGHRPIRRPYTVRIPRPRTAWQYFQIVAFAALILAVIVLLFRNPINPDAPEPRLRVTYSRSVEAVKLGSHALSLDLMDLAKQMREQQLTQDVLSERLHDSIRRAMLVAGEGPLKNLDELKPWDPMVIADHLESSADAFNDVSNTLQRLKRP